ncbi:shikimate dehydrogenase [Nordella sp. HKS 07]|uniref:shikimate dehydrogenase n=1 Tax=Nordella sp. HKS 07 TaxID=2712222 RepID=UPI0013E19158|nr:shikimate dehydrogenase [Nordella sp. HKS 07]QIG48208.1 shikimate dehydrogenase [Nordella sp. HKS 07]
MTRKACVIGWPISHSRSPLIHGYWLKRYGIAGSYERLPVKPEELSAFFSSLMANGLAGCNVTLPHKEAAFRAVRTADAATARLSVVNTVFARDGELWGTSTDGEGFLASLAAGHPGWRAAGQSVVILGAGGATRALVGALLDAGAGRIFIANRTRAKAEELKRDFGCRAEPHDWAEASDLLRHADLVINTTSLGMTGQPALEIDLGNLPNTALVTDIVYTPLETDLLKRAEARGNPIVPGLGMLLHQAVRGFELWFGTRPEVTDDLYDLVARDIDPGYRR